MFKQSTSESERIRAILHELARLYPVARPELHFTNPYETLMATMLSAQCTDKQVNKVTPAVFSRWPDIASLAEADLDELFPMVKSCGFRSKASNMIAACQRMVLEYNSEVPSTREELVTLPGVGRKTANVVLANAFGQPTFAVDTHVFRLSNRMGLAHADNVLDTEKQLMANVPESEWVDNHHRLLLHGRRVCKSQHPLCDQCTIRPYCRYYQKSEQDSNSDS